MKKFKVRKKDKIIDLIKEELGEIGELEEELHLKKEIGELEVPEKPEVRLLSKKIQDNIQFLNSCVIPKGGEEITITKTQVEIGRNRFLVEYPVIERDGKFEYVDISYLADSIVRRIGGDFGVLGRSAESKFLAKNILEWLGIKYDSIAMFFLDRCFLSANSRDSLAMYFGYCLLTPNKVSRVEDTRSYDEFNRRVVNVYTLEFRDVDKMIVGAGISIAKHLGRNIKINPCYE